jgi:hypothetical protein
MGIQVTNDAQIRNLLIPFVQSEHKVAAEHIVLIPEFAMYGGANRADLAALNGLSHGYEIKSDRDRLLRLPQQVRAYNAVFERATFVGARRHLSSARSIIPGWWGIISVVCSPTSDVHLERIRKSRPNPSPDREAIAALLWRPEALQLLTSLGLDAGVRSKPMSYLTARLAQRIGAEHLSFYVRQAIRARGDWRSGARLRQCDDTYQRPSSLSRYRRTPYENICR